MVKVVSHTGFALDLEILAGRFEAIVRELDELDTQTAADAQCGVNESAVAWSTVAPESTTSTRRHLIKRYRTHVASAGYMLLRMAGHHPTQVDKLAEVICLRGEEVHPWELNEPANLFAVFVGGRV